MKPAFFIRIPRGVRNLPTKTPQISAGASAVTGANRDKHTFKIIRFLSLNRCSRDTVATLVSIRSHAVGVSAGSCLRLIVLCITQL